jgi:hypothetical protein
MRRVLVFVLWILCSSAFAHLEAVRVEAIFPTASRSGIQVQLLGSSSGLKVTGAKLELEFRGPDGSNNRQAFIEGPPGIYRVDRGFQEGNYTFKVIDKTFTAESLEREIVAALPRPNGQDVQIWDWPATPFPGSAAGSAAPGTPPANQGVPVLVIALLGIPVLLAVMGLGVLMLTRRSRTTSES